MLAAVAIAVLAVAPVGQQEWFEVRTTSTDSTDVYAHDQKSGLLAIASTGAGMMDPVQRLERVRQSGRLIRQDKSRIGRKTWETFEFSDPTEDARGLQADLGAEPKAGSWTAALLESLNPPSSCDRKVKGFLGEGREMLAVTAVVCSSYQRERLDQYATELAKRKRPLVVRSLGPSHTLRADQMPFLEAGQSVASVVAVIGGPFQVWRRCPAGFTWLYPADAAVGAYVAVDFDDQRRVVNVRKLSESIWE